MNMTKTEYGKEWKKNNRDKMNAYQRKYWKKNKKRLLGEAKLRRKVRPDKHHLKRKYGITEERYNEMVVAQNNVCAICGKPSERRLDVDHNHTTGQVRELLCGRCNKGLGLFNDDPELLGKVILYLTKHSAPSLMSPPEP